MVKVVIDELGCLFCFMSGNKEKDAIIYIEGRVHREGSANAQFVLGDEASILILQFFDVAGEVSEFKGLIGETFV